MRWQDAERAARAELDALGLQDWAVVRDRARSRLGQCRYRKQELGLSGAYVDLNDWAEVRDTLRHEAAHALVGEGHGHDRVWKRQAVALGVDPRSTGGYDAVLPRGPISIVCPRCGEVGTRHKRPRPGARYVHNACGEQVMFTRSDQGV